MGLIQKIKEFKKMQEYWKHYGDLNKVELCEEELIKLFNAANKRIQKNWDKIK